ncbi:DotH/IcmK family type IV secretion protein [Chromobacterium sp. CV08]|uniref:DotH/IcmK family type IV secretion protein n=1 Tax=Chromobacterium sp. CV08 TaxID=3133274 RepID=UPI003DA92BEB
MKTGMAAGLLLAGAWVTAAAAGQAADGQFYTGSAGDPRLAMQSAAPQAASRAPARDPLQRAMEADPVFGSVMKEAVPFDPGQIRMYRRQVDKVERLKDSPPVSGEQRTIPVRPGRTVDLTVAVGYPLTVRLTDVAGQPLKISGSVPGMSFLTVHPIPGDGGGGGGGASQAAALAGVGAPAATAPSGGEAKDAIVIDSSGSGTTSLTVFAAGSFRPIVVRVKSIYPKGGEKADFAADLRLTWMGGDALNRGDEYQSPLSGPLMAVLKETVGEEMQTVPHNGGDAIKVWRRLSDSRVFVKVRPGVTLLSPRNFRTSTRDDDGGSAYEFDYRPSSMVAGMGGGARAIVIRWGNYEQ